MIWMKIVSCLNLMLVVAEMGTREIKSPESLPQTPVNFDGVAGSSNQRKKLQTYFIESDNRRMAMGRGYTGGTTPVNVHGKPIADLSKTGGWIAALFIFGTILVLDCYFVLCNGE